MHESMTDRPSSHAPSTTLPRHFYTDENLYQREVAWLRRNMWLLVGHESEIPTPGDYFLYEFDQDSVIVIRDAQREVRAHHNVCRHRGSRLCEKAAGSVKAISCPYHAWT